MTEKKEKRKSQIGLRRKGRELCVQALYQYERGQNEVNRILDLNWVAGTMPDSRSVDYFRTLFKGTLEHLEEVDSWIREFANCQDENRMMPIDRAILRFAVHSLLKESDISSVVIISEAVELAKLYSGNNAHKFINGVLDGIRKKLVAEDKRVE